MRRLFFHQIRRGCHTKCSLFLISEFSHLLLGKRRHCHKKLPPPFSEYSLPEWQVPLHQGPRNIRFLRYPRLPFTYKVSELPLSLETFKTFFFHECVTENIRILVLNADSFREQESVSFVLYLSVNGTLCPSLI